MKHWLSISAAFFGLATSVGATEIPTHQFDCDTPNGHYSRWKMSYAAESARIRGTVKLLEPRAEGDWIPGAHVYLYGENGNLIVGLVLTAEATDPATLWVSLIERGNRKSDRPFAAFPWKDESFSFEFTLDASGVIEASVNGASQKIDEPGFHLSAVGLRCTSGNFVFDDVSVVPGVR